MVEQRTYFSRYANPSRLKDPRGEEVLFKLNVKLNLNLSNPRAQATGLLDIQDQQPRSGPALA